MFADKPAVKLLVEMFAKVAVVLVNMCSEAWI